MDTTAIELTERSPILRRNSTTINTADIIAAVVDFFLMPKYRGIKHIPEVAIALIKKPYKLFIPIETVKSNRRIGYTVFNR